jgi:PPP family 3-phenylpropionic acid transporter
VEYPLALAFAQLLHCLGFAVLHFAMVLSAQRLFPAGLASRGQALFSSVGYGLGGMLGNLLAGVIWVGFSPRTSYVSAAFIVVLAAVLAIVGLRGTVLDSRPTIAA